MTEEHRCAAGAGCRSSETYEDTKTGKTLRQGAVIAEPIGLCPGCVKSVKYAVEDLPADYVALHVSLGESNSNTEAKVNSTRNPAVPIDVYKYSLMSAISENLDHAADVVSDELHCNPPAGKISVRLQRAATMVAANLPKLLAKGDVPLWVWEPCDIRCGQKGCDKGEHLRLSDRTGIETALALRDVHRRARGVVGELEKILRIERLCGQCGAPRIYQNPTTNVVFCKECGRDWTEELLGLAGRMIKDKEQEQRDMAINEEFEQRALRAEWRVAELEWMLSLAHSYTEVSAAEFMQEIMQSRVKMTA